MANRSFALRNEKFIVFLILILTLMGARAYVLCPQSIFPPMTFARIDVVMDVGDLPPDQVSSTIIRPFDTAFQELPAVTRVRSTASQGNAEFVLDFAPTTDARTDLQYVNQALAEVTSTVPSARNLSAVIVNPNSEPIFSYAVTASDMSSTALRTFFTHYVLPQLYGETGLGRVRLVGGSTTEFHIDLDPLKMQARELSVSTVASTISALTTVTAVGSFERYYQHYIMIVDAGVHDSETLARLAIPLKNGQSVPLSELGTVTNGVAPITVDSSYNAAPAVLLNVYALPDADTVRLAADFSARLVTVQKALPMNMHIRKFWDQTTLITASQTALKDAILIGAILAIVVIFVFLRDLRLVLIAAALIPLALAIAIFALQSTGQTLNLMSVGGLAVAVGLIIDDAIVVIENIARNLHASRAASPAGIIAQAMQQITPAMVASTLTTVVVFLPLTLLSGVSGFFFRALAFTLAVSLLVSLALALTLAPIIAARMLRSTNAPVAEESVSAAKAGYYERLLRYCLRHRLLVACGSAVTLIVTILLLATIQSDFLPSMDEGQFEIAYTLPSGTDLHASASAATSMERIVRADPAVDSVGRMTGIDSNGISPIQANQGSLRVRLRPPEVRDTFDVVSERLRHKLETQIPAAQFDLHQILEDIINDLSGTASPLAITISGDDQAKLIMLATQVATKLQAIPGIVDTTTGVVYNNPALVLLPSGDRLSQLGVTSTDVIDRLTAGTAGIVAATLPGANAAVPIRVTERSAQDLETQLQRFGTVIKTRPTSNINFQNGRRDLVVTANIAHVQLSELNPKIQKALRSLQFPPGYDAVVGGEIATQAQSFSDFVKVIALAVVLVYAVMLATFRSFRLPFVVLTAIPLALIGVAGALRLSGTPFNVSSFMGLLLLVGVVVKNGILLIDVATREQSAGLSTFDAVLIAGKTRLRPIVMTTLAAIGGLFPLALGIGQGAELEKPLAIAVIGGLSTATIFTLLVIPVLYASFAGRDAAPTPATI